MAHPNNFIGKKYGHLTIKAIAKYRTSTLYVECECDCGKSGIFKLESLKSGKIQSCGCIKVPYSSTFEENVRKRIESLIEVQGECWIWKGLYRMINNRFYPFFNSHRKQYNPVRWFAEQQGEVVHRNWNFIRQCENEKCVNPDHHVKVAKCNVKKALKKEIKCAYLKRRESR